MQIPSDLVDAVQDAHRVVVLTGAGISAESGIPTFREAQTGLWARYDPMELASPQAFSRNPELVWDWYRWRRELIESANPNPGHLALAQLESMVPHFALITQNVDGMHLLAGSRKILELHGNIFRNLCSRERRVVDPEPSEEAPPPCPRCGAPVRPDVVWFGESLPPDVLQSALEAVEQAEVFFSIGTSALVHPAASLPVAAVRAGALGVEINPDETPVSRWMRFRIRAKAGEALPPLVQAIESRRGERP